MITNVFFIHPFMSGSCLVLSPPPRFGERSEGGGGFIFRGAREEDLLQETLQEHLERQWDEARIPLDTAAERLALCHELDTASLYVLE